MEFELLKKTDVMLASYPRSGNTWMINLFMSLGVMVLAGRAHSLRIERAIDLPDEPSEYIPALKRLKARSGEKLARVRVIKTHDRYDPKYGKAIYIIRDGRDSVVSFYFYSRRFNGYHGNFSDFLNQTPSPAREWAEHVESWLSGSNSEVFFLKYEDMIWDGFASIERALGFLGEVRPEEEIHEAIRLCSFENLNRHEQAIKPSPEADLGFFRKGKIGDWREAFGPEHIAKFKEDANWMLLRLGYEASEDWS